jgi:hypothetical protein
MGLHYRDFITSWLEFMEAGSQDDIFPVKKS